MPNWRLYLKMATVTGICVIGGPALVYYVMPTEEELFKRYNPDLQRRALRDREKREKEFDEFVTDLKKHSRSDRAIWYEQARSQKQAQAEQKQQPEESAS